jgi:ubiquinone/menaquinone biosynthesis C-methylase UbiE
MLKEQGVFSPFTLGYGMQQIQPGIGDMRYNEDAAYQEIRDIINKNINERIQSQQMQNIATAGGIANLAGGGIAKLAGDRSGAMLESMNPDKDGLPGLLKRVKKV